MFISLTLYLYAALLWDQGHLSVFVYDIQGKVSLPDVLKCCIEISSSRVVLVKYRHMKCIEMKSVRAYCTMRF